MYMAQAWGYQFEVSKTSRKSSTSHRACTVLEQDQAAQPPHYPPIQFAPGCSSGYSTGTARRRITLQARSIEAHCKGNCSPGQGLYQHKQKNALPRLSGPVQATEMRYLPDIALMHCVEHLARAFRWHWATLVPRPRPLTLGRPIHKGPLAY